MRNHHARPDGFTMIELMMVVAVVGILAAIAIPSYHSYTVRTKVTECLNMASPARISVSETAAGTVPAPFNFLSTRYCDDVQIAEGGVIVMETQDTGAATSPILQLVPVAGAGGAPISWDCELVAGRAAHVPAHCRTPGVRAEVSVAHTAPGPSTPDGAGSTAGSGGAGGAGASGTGSGADGASGGGDSTSAGSSAGDSGSTDTGAAGGDATGGSATGGGATGGGATGGGATGGGATGGGATGGGATGGGATGGGASGGGASGGGASGGGASGGGASGGGAIGGDDAEDDDTECEHRLPNGRPHPGRCGPGAR